MRVVRFTAGIAIVFVVLFAVVRTSRTQQIQVAHTPPKSVYVAVDGEMDADGSLADPLPLDIALSAKSPLRPGDTLWLRGGTYRGSFTSAVSGASWGPIKVRRYPGERVVIDSAPSQRAALTVQGAWTEFWDFEITNSDSLRTIAEPGSWPAGLRRSGGIDARGPHNKLINMVIHDMSDGIGIWSEAEGTSAYGNIIFYNGWEGPDRSHGHGIYTQNQQGVREIENNIIFDQFSHGIHAYGSSVAYLDNITLRGNIVFNNGAIANSGGERDILVGGGRVAQSTIIEDNATYGPEQSNVGYAAGCAQATIARNHFSGLSPLILVSCRPNLTGNTFVGPVGSVEALAAEYPNNHYYSATPPQGHDAIVRPNRYDPSRVHIAIYNWDLAPEVNVALPPVMSDGAPYEVIDVQDYFGPPVVSGTYHAGTPVAIPMSGQRITPTMGTVSHAPRHTGPEFGVFVLHVLGAESLQR